MFCQYCLSSSATTSLLPMGTSFFEFNRQKVNYLDCFTFCKLNRIEDELNAKICPACMALLRADYITKQIKTDQPNTLSFAVTAIKEEKSFKSTAYSQTNQVAIIFQIEELKAKPTDQIIKSKQEQMDGNKSTSS
jgi:hypothetical protein